MPASPLSRRSSSQQDNHEDVGVPRVHASHGSQSARNPKASKITIGGGADIHETLCLSVPCQEFIHSLQPSSLVHFSYRCRLKRFPRDAHGRVVGVAFVEFLSLATELSNVPELIHGVPTTPTGFPTTRHSASRAAISNLAQLSDGINASRRGSPDTRCRP